MDHPDECLLGVHHSEIEVVGATPSSPNYTEKGLHPKALTRRRSGLQNSQCLYEQNRRSPLP